MKQAEYSCSKQNRCNSHVFIKKKVIRSKSIIKKKADDLLCIEWWCNQNIWVQDDAIKYMSNRYINETSGWFSKNSWDIGLSMTLMKCIQYSTRENLISNYSQRNWKKKEKILWTSNVLRKLKKYLNYIWHHIHAYFTEKDY